jgi:hypothetical protein
LGGTAVARALPLQVRFFSGESVGSYVTRLAARNGLSVQQLLESMGEGLSAASVDPRYTELYVDRAGREQLAALSGRPVADMVRALPSLADEHLLATQGSVPVWRWPWSPHGGYLVRGCALCAAARGIDTPVWMVRADTWHICVRHARFTDNSRDDAHPFIDLSPGPHVVEAEQKVRKLERRYGRVGRSMVADAFGIHAHGATRLRLGSRRTAVLHLLPHVAALAQSLLSVEMRRLAGRLTKDEHAHWGLNRHKGRGLHVSQAFAMWGNKHSLLAQEGAAPGCCPAQPDPHPRVGSLQSVDEIMCLPAPPFPVPERPYG